MNIVFDRYNSCLMKWLKFDDLVAEAIIAGRPYKKLLEQRDKLKPKLDYAEQQFNEFNKAFIDMCKRDLEERNLEASR